MVMHNVPIIVPMMHIAHKRGWAMQSVGGLGPVARLCANNMANLMGPSSGGQCHAYMSGHP